MRPKSDAPTPHISDNDNGIVQGVDPREFPCLTRLLDGPAGPILAAEISALLHRRARALRRTVELLGRLDSASFRQTVRIRDLSRSGARVRLPRRGYLDLMTSDAMRLRCRVASDDMSESHDMDVPVALVRIVEHGHDYLEVGLRFTALDTAQRQLLETIERLYFFA